MLNQIFGWLLWVKHPRTKAHDAMLTFSAMAVLVCSIKVLLNEVTINVGGHVINCGRIDPMLIAAMLTPTLAAYWARKKDERNKAPPTES